MTQEPQPGPDQEQPSPPPNPLAQALAAEQEAERLERQALNLPRSQAKVALQLAKSYRAGAKLRRKQVAWEQENPPETNPQSSNSPQGLQNPPSDSQADFNL